MAYDSLRLPRKLKICLALSDVTRYGNFHNKLPSKYLYTEINHLISLTNIASTYLDGTKTPIGGFSERFKFSVSCSLSRPTFVDLIKESGNGLLW